VTAAEAGSSQAALKAAIATGEVVELPPQRLEDAQTRFDDLQVRKRREQMAVKAEARRTRREEAALARLEAKRAEENGAEETAVVNGGRPKGRKEAVPSRIVPQGRMWSSEERKRMLAKAAEQGGEQGEGQGGGQGVLDDEGDAEAQAAWEEEMATVQAMQAMAPHLRERILRRMVREGLLGPPEQCGGVGLLAEYAASLGLLEMALTPRGRVNESKLREATEGGPRWTAKGREARDGLAERAQQRAEARRAAMGRLHSHRRGGGGGDDGGDGDDTSSYTSSSCGDSEGESDVDERSKGDARGGAAGSFSATGGAQGKVSGRGWFGGLWFSSARRGDTAAGDGPTGDTSGAGGAGRGEKARRHRRRRTQERVGANGQAGGGGGTVDEPRHATPTFMLPLLSKMRQRAVEEQAAFEADGGDPQLERWRIKWDDKYAGGGGSAAAAALRSHRPVSCRAASSQGTASLRPLLSASHASSRGPPQSSSSSWELVRARVGDITLMA